MIFNHSKRQYTEKSIVFIINKTIPKTILEREKSCYKTWGKELI